MADITAYMKPQSSTACGNPSCTSAGQSSTRRPPHSVSTTPTYWGWRRPALNGKP
eukprot:CAMPEP_0185906664 /NCGR_PEP_ID=MMETSP0196C-20130402/5783_1 /TAXON_ID=2932 /ORGANISM="Alexandrium fundyense, Strain CCMP1719" /LENGTH=54 /DNA_ID=CAMNT_0028626465 /DNA_START=120 /DNA_END=284 /DNA_ORIENTATION=-